MRIFRVWLRWLASALAFLVMESTAYAAWHEAKSAHFIIYADLAPGELKAYGERLERFDQAVRKLRSMDDPPLTDAQRLTIFALRDEAAVGRLVGSPDILGFYFSSAAGAYAFVPRKAGYIIRRAEMTPESVFFHEYAHHLQLAESSTPLPAWVTEGFAEFFSTAEIRDDGSVQIGSPPMERQWSVHRYDGFPITEMLGGTLRGMTARDFESLYGRGWALMHLLTFDPARRDQLKRYIDSIQRGIAPLQAAKSAFGDDLRALNRDLDQYLRQRSFNTLVVEGSALTPSPISIRPLRPGEAAVIEQTMRLRRGIDRKEAARLASQLSRLAATYPADPVVHVVHGQAALAARDYGVAETAGRRAAAADPKLSSAPILVGKAQMEIGRTNPGQANWKEIRSWFLRANKLDPENAEPLMLFYRSFLHAGASPTRNAIDGLLYAVNLAPRDESLRIDAVRQLVVDNRLDEARKMFATAAYYPHSDQEWRATKTTIMEALTKADRATALRLLDAEQKKRWSDEDED